MHPCYIYKNMSDRIITGISKMANTRADDSVGDNEYTWHISVIVSSNTPPASSAPSPTSLTFHALEGRRRSDAFSLTTCLAIWTKMGLHFRPLQEKGKTE